MKVILYITIVAIALSLTVIVATWWWLHRPQHHLTWHQVNAMIAHHFPEVPQISVADLDTWFHDSHRKPPLLIDVRSRAEYAVSHLHNARWIDTLEHVSKAMAGVSHTESIVTYCSVGYRSSAYAQRLLRDGFTNVRDLKGSIFEWGNGGLPVYRHDRVVHHVHPYNRYWGLLLKRSLWAFSPAPTAETP